MKTTCAIKVWEYDSSSNTGDMELIIRNHSRTEHWVVIAIGGHEHAVKANDLRAAMNRVSPDDTRADDRRGSV
jgi:hypothetical protein